MSGLRRIGLFLITNLLVIIVISIIAQFLGLDAGSYMGLLILCSLFGMTGAFISLWLSKFMAKKAYKIRLIEPQSATARELYIYDMIDKMAAHHGFKTPEVGIYNAKEVNAFATGASKDASLVAFSSGLLATLNDEELAAVAAHEMSHIKNGDMVTMTLLVGIANTFVMFFARVLAYGISAASKGNNRNGGYMGRYLMVILFENVLMLLAYIPISAFSRKREYRADHGASEITNPNAMIAALQKIESYYYPEQKKDSFAMAKINNKHRVSLYATHPSIADRIKRLQEFTK